jgi:hypothetical protein
MFITKLVHNQTSTYPNQPPGVYATFFLCRFSGMSLPLWMEEYLRWRRRGRANAS